MLNLLLPSLLLSLLAVYIHRLSQPSRKPGSHRLSQPSRHVWFSERTGITLSISTQNLNYLPRSILQSLRSSFHPRLKKTYELLAWVGVVGGVIALLGALWACLDIWWSLWEEATVHASSPSTTGSWRRHMSKVQEQRRGLQPLIPGITTPISHLPTMLLGLVINQLIHELGHALSASLDDVQPSRFSLSLHLFLPSASVSFPSSVDFLSPKAKMRLAAAGAGHNLVCWIILWSITVSGMGSMFWYDRSAEGRVVQNVRPGSPLAGHLKPGDIITHLDDSVLGGGLDIWTDYLSGDEVGDQSRGWCYPRSDYLDLPLHPCLSEENISFDPLDPRDVPESRCLNPHPLLDNPSTPCMCDASMELCIRPSLSERILRIRTTNKVVIWAGDRMAVLEGVQVSGLDGRLWPGAIRWGEMYIGYLKTISISLFLFNLLPLPSTDGAHLFRALLSLHHSSKPWSPGQPRHLQASLGQGQPRINIYREYELADSDSEDYESALGHRDPSGGMRREEVWKRRLRRGVEGMSLGLVVVWTAGWGMVGLLRSS
ncbi:hypothetical protein M231_04882 [Tremella mesenterica]|uniref:Endopeptidase S2P n=1 Tax=Tremella mesenterica TaxID=5217 RepID=A0A4Q1BJJ6_TREME|nr:hypothetical protein M231_04882 [Tremella mesenterica]